MRSNGIISYDQVGESEEETLKCYTDVEGCCMQETAANWKYPDGSVVKHRGLARSEDMFYVTRGEMEIRLHRKKSVRFVDKGLLLKCEILDSKGHITISSHIGLYRLDLNSGNSFLLS